ncbi:hypothetical protein ZOD2009_19843 [Haladaptatus paucihalophilus DX253]|uniref:Uncharacterized protein n=1 Tax=Haladaptatus paucihalophilus DX253 TaxID=797209 RepID=E7QYS8_HALPU|nr:hypothetical protein ZOD2009_19843 [Haladaptatus paucihalophilus DX253]
MATVCPARESDGVARTVATGRSLLQDEIALLRRSHRKL